MIRFLRWTSLLATLGLTSTFEFQAGIAAGLDWWLAALLPLAIDTYVMSALLQGWDRLPALLILEAAVAAGATHAHYGNPAKLGVSLALGTIITAVLWRVDSLFHRAEREKQRGERQAAQEKARQESEQAAAQRRHREEAQAAEDRRTAAAQAEANAAARKAEAEAAQADAAARRAEAEAAQAAAAAEAQRLAAEALRLQAEAEAVREREASQRRRETSPPASGKSARDLVHAAHHKDPARTQADIARDLGLSTKTVGRHWPKPHLSAVRDVAEA